MEINEETIQVLLEPADFSFVYSDKARRAFGLDPQEFEDAVEEYHSNFSDVDLQNNQMLFHIKATSIIGQLNAFHRNLNGVVNMQKASGGLGDIETKAIMQKSKRVFAEGVNILAPYSALLLIATETKNYA